MITRANATVPPAPEGLADEETADSSEPGTDPEDTTAPSTTETTTTTASESTTTAPDESGEPPPDDGASDESEGETPP